MTAVNCPASLPTKASRRPAEPEHTQDETSGD
jgi:hypothetical protein